MLWADGGTVAIMPCSTLHQIQSTGRRSTPRGPPDAAHSRLCNAAGYLGCLRLPDARRSYIVGPGELYDWTRTTLGQKTNTILISMHRWFPESIFGEALGVSTRKFCTIGLAV